jgi:hypothetical protein
MIPSRFRGGAIKRWRCGQTLVQTRWCKHAGSSTLVQARFNWVPLAIISADKLL